MSNTISGLVIPADISQKPYLKEFSFTQTLSDIKDVVKGYVEGTKLNKSIRMFMNEAGHIKNLPFNPVASCLCAITRGIDHIAGDVVLLGTTDEYGFDTSVDETTAQKLISLAQSI